MPLISIQVVTCINRSLFCLTRLSGYATIYLFIHLLKDIWVASSLGDYRENSHEHTRTGFCVDESFSPLGYISTSSIAGSCGKCSLNLQNMSNFSRVTATFHVPTDNLWETSCSASVPAFGIGRMFVDILVGMPWYYGNSKPRGPVAEG